MICILVLSLLDSRCSCNLQGQRHDIKHAEKTIWVVLQCGHTQHSDIYKA